MFEIASYILCIYGAALSHEYIILHFYIRKLLLASLHILQVYFVAYFLDDMYARDECLRCWIVSCRSVYRGRVRTVPDWIFNYSAMIIMTIQNIWCYFELLLQRKFLKMYRLFGQDINKYTRRSGSEWIPFQT